MKKTALTRRRVLQMTAVATATLVAPSARSAGAAGNVVPSGKLVLAWHTNIAARWLDPQQHDGGASPDNFIMALHDALSKTCASGATTTPLSPKPMQRPRTPKARLFGCAPASSFMTARRSRSTT